MNEMHAFGGRIRRVACSQVGQATVEYLLVGAVLIFIIVGMGALWRFVANGGLDSFVFSRISHSIIGKGLVDALLF